MYRVLLCGRVLLSASVAAALPTSGSVAWWGWRVPDNASLNDCIHPLSEGGRRYHRTCGDLRTPRMRFLNRVGSPYACAVLQMPAEPSTQNEEEMKELRRRSP